MVIGGVGGVEVCVWNSHLGTSLQTPGEVRHSEGSRNALFQGKESTTELHAKPMAPLGLGVGERYRSPVFSGSPARSGRAVGPDCLLKHLGGIDVNFVQYLVNQPRCTCNFFCLHIFLLHNQSINVPSGNPELIGTGGHVR